MQFGFDSKFKTLHGFQINIRELVYQDYVGLFKQQSVRFVNIKLYPMYMLMYIGNLVIQNFVSCVSH